MVTEMVVMRMTALGVSSGHPVCSYSGDVVMVCVSIPNLAKSNTIEDRLQVPHDLVPGDWVLQWRWGKQPALVLYRSASLPHWFSS